MRLLAPKQPTGRWTSLRLLLLSGFLVAGSGCGAARWRQLEEVRDTPGLVVELERHADGEGPIDLGFAHPARLSAEPLAAVLAELGHRSLGLLASDEVRPVIDPALTLPLAEAIAHGLARAEPSDRVRFLARNRHQTLGFLPGERHTRGVAFVTPGDGETELLNLAFDQVNATPEPDEMSELPRWEDPTWNLHASVELLLPEGARLHSDAMGRTRPLWLVMPVPRGAPGEGRSDGEKTDSTPPQGTPPGSDPPPLDLPPQVIESDPAAARRMDLPPKDGRPQVLSDSERLARLRYLEELHRTGVIDDAEYEKQKRALLAE